MTDDELERYSSLILAETSESISKIRNYAIGGRLYPPFCTNVFQDFAINLYASTVTKNRNPRLYLLTPENHLFRSSFSHETYLGN